MKVLIIRNSPDEPNVEYLQAKINLPITINHIEDTDSIAIFDCNYKDIPYDWPDYVIKVGTCQTGRAHIDDTIPEEGSSETIVDILETIEITGTDEQEGEFPE